MKIVLILVPQTKLLFFFDNGSFDETQMFDTNIKRSVGLSENKKQRCLKFKSLPTLFQVSYETNHLFILLEGSTIVGSKLEIVDALKKNTGNATEEL